MSVKLIVTLKSNSDGINFNAEIDDSEKIDVIEETLAQYLLAACIKELGCIRDENNHEGD